MCPHTMCSHVARDNGNPLPPAPPTATPLLILSWKRFDFRKSRWFRFTNLDVYLTLPVCGLPSCLGSRSCYLGRTDGEKDVKCPLRGGERVVSSAGPENSQISLMSPHYVEETNPTREAESVQVRGVCLTFTKGSRGLAGGRRNELRHRFEVILWEKAGYYYIIRI